MTGLCRSDKNIAEIQEIGVYESLVRFQGEICPRWVPTDYIRSKIKEERFKKRNQPLLRASTYNKKSRNGKVEITINEFHYHDHPW